LEFVEARHDEFRDRILLRSYVIADSLLEAFANAFGGDGVEVGGGEDFIDDGAVGGFLLLWDC
jgi:hypothetical protein